MHIDPYIFGGEVRDEWQTVFPLIARHYAGQLRADNQARTLRGDAPVPLDDTLSEALAIRAVPVKEINWLGDTPFDSADEWHVSVKVRSTRPPREAVIRPLSATTAEVELLTPEEGISPGQACVFYETTGSRILGGGWIWNG